MAFLPTSASSHTRPQPEITQIGKQTIIHGAAESFPQISQAFPPIDIFIFDPPAVDHDWAAFEYEKWFKGIIAIINNCAAPNAALILIPQNRKGGGWLKGVSTASITQSSGWLLWRLIIWKQQRADFHRAGYPFREIFFFRRGNMPTNSASPLRHKDMIKIIAPQSPGFGGEIPIEMIKLCLSLFNRPGFTIMDPFAGTGSVAATCEELECSSISIELDRDAYLGIIKRVKRVRGRLV